MEKLLFLLGLFAVSKAMTCGFYSNDIYTCSEFVLEKGQPLVIEKNSTFPNISLTDINGGIDETTFTLLPETETLILAYSNITEIKDDVICKILPKLEGLDFSFNHALPKLTLGILKNCEKIKTFKYTSRNNETEFTNIIDSSFSLSFPNVEEIELYSVNFKHLEKEFFSGLSKLKKIRIIASKIEKLDDGVFCSNPNLEHLELDGSIPENEKMFQGCTNIKSLHFNNKLGNNIHEKTFQGLVNLKKFELRSGLTDINNQIFKGLKQLERLTIMYSSTETIQPDAFQDLSNLNKLRIEHTKLKAVRPELFIPLTNLKVLIITISDLESAENIKNLPSLTTLDISQNKIKKLDAKEVMENLPNLKEISIYSWGRLIKCEEMVKIARDFGSEIKVNHPYDDDKECSRAKALRQRPIGSVVPQPRI